MIEAEAFLDFLRDYRKLRTSGRLLHENSLEAKAVRLRLDLPWAVMDQEQQHVISWLLSQLDQDPPCAHEFVVAMSPPHLVGSFPEERCRKCGMIRQYDTEFDGVHLKIRARDRRPIECGWDLLYAIKNLVVGPDVRMVEVFPPSAELVNEENTRHLFVVPEGVLPSGLFGWGDVKERA